MYTDEPRKMKGGAMVGGSVLKLSMGYGGSPRSTNRRPYTQREH